MYTYEYETVTVSLEAFVGYTFGSEYQQLIDQRARAGWRYVGQLPVQQNGHGLIKKIDLIFEKEV